MKTQNKQQVIAAALLILAAACSRLLPHPPNFVPIGALGIFGGAVISDKKYAFIFPLGALLLSDMLFEMFTSTPGFYGWGQLFVYAAFMITTFLATRIKEANVGNILLACIWSGVIFFLISNFGDWVARDWYPKTFSGLMACYTAALAFYKNDILGSFALNSVISNVFYAGILFGGFALVKNLGRNMRTQKVRS